MAKARTRPAPETTTTDAQLPRAPAGKMNRSGVVCMCIGILFIGDGLLTAASDPSEGLPCLALGILLVFLARRYRFPAAAVAGSVERPP